MKRSRRWRGRTPQIVAAIGVLVALAATWFFGRPLSEVERHRRHFAEIQRQLAIAEEGRTARAADRGRVMRLRAQARTAVAAQRGAFEAEAAGIEARLAWGDRLVVRSVVLSNALLRLNRSTEVTAVTPAGSTAGNGCVNCHVGIATSGLEKYPLPFRTHPKLSAYVGADSPHPPSRVGCASCHQGDPHADSFQSALHPTPGAFAAPISAVRAEEVSAPMLPAASTEANCSTCHAGERYQPPAASLNEAVLTLERGGCYACHDIPGMERAPKRGPDLRHIASKLSTDWVRAWLANPRALKPATWMPRFWTNDTQSADDAAAIEAVTAYLFDVSAPAVPPAASARAGDATRGRSLVESVGCLGCHIVGREARDTASLRRTFGQPLDGVGSKTSLAWLESWVQDPSRFSANTRMPSLRLTDQEAADAASYLSTLTGEGNPIVPPVRSDDAAMRRVVARYAPRDSGVNDDARTATADRLRTLAGRVAINAIGCFNCHEIRGFEDQRRTVPIRGDRVWHAAQVAEVHAQGDPARASLGSPDYGLGNLERRRLALGLTAIAERGRSTHVMSMPWQVVKVTGRRLVQERNCVGCHVIEGTGGDFVSLVSEPTLGPPLLTPEGSRVQADWLRGFLREPKTIRPWLTVRMPTFPLTDDERAEVGDYLRAIAPENPQASAAPAGVTAAAGKELFDLLKCQQCHVMGSIPADQPTANLAPDLRVARERLQPEWILAWLRNPAAILPGTRMPTFWPDYPQSFYAPLDKDGAKQVRAIRDHLIGMR